VRAIALSALAALGCSGRSLPSSGALGPVDPSPADLASADRAIGPGQGGSCQVNLDCTGPAMFCLAPGTFAGCGTCTPAPSCATDGDCAGDAGIGPVGGGHVCDDPQIHFQCGACAPLTFKVCLRGCVDSSGCVGGRVCASGHCVWAPCTTNADCALDFGCIKGQCQRMPCIDGACPGGVCVQTECFPNYGTCTPVPL
jgi:hypothetical protein